MKKRQKLKQPEGNNRICINYKWNTSEMQIKMWLKQFYERIICKEIICEGLGS